MASEFQPRYKVLTAVIGASVLLFFAFLLAAAQENARQAPHDAVMEAQQSQTVPLERPEQQKTDCERKLPAQPIGGKSQFFYLFWFPVNVDGLAVKRNFNSPHISQLQPDFSLGMDRTALLRHQYFLAQALTVGRNR